VGHAAANEVIQVGTAAFVWNGLGLKGELAGTGDYLVKAEVRDATGTHVYSKVLTLIMQKEAVLGGIALGPNPAKTFLTIDLSQLAPGIEIAISIWSLNGELVREFHVATGPGSKVIWDLNSAGGQAISNGIYVAMIRSTQNDSRLQDKRYFKFAITRN
jgi:hypothetical protein